ncbi:hypothetical protein CPB83DRAFT_774777 [Crepidotus variabilis]|uniref:Uncharacterized protein n=1 Tax=Crepidotus variabilis TaxID=179855 RepID=A0A9P6E7E5_9AGAR|nr:hypothetical protein CPB83DRAFT_774777 [Crepidotus variabilis]
MTSSTLTSVYRLFLRTVSVSVLHQRSACLNLRRRWRPVFDAAAKVSLELQNVPAEAAQAYRLERLAWLVDWNKRIDNTLALLYNSANTRGLAHQVTRNLAHLAGLERVRALASTRRLPKWNPQGATPSQAKLLKTLEIKRLKAQFVANGLGAMNELVRVAEGSAGLAMGRQDFVVRRWTDQN